VVFMQKILNKAFFEDSALKVARELLGKYLVIREKDREKAYMITEVEAYDGFEDKASHAHKGKTARNEIMFGEAGYWYIYFVYGMYNMLNIVTGKYGYPAAVLIRGLEGINGPGKLTKKLRIDRRFNKKKADKKTGLWIEDRDFRLSESRIEKTPRIGVGYAGACAKKPYRFVLKNKAEIMN
jgi:DNA-3-methyladenine glycosylase